MKRFDIGQAREVTNIIFRAILDRDVDPAALRHYSLLLIQNEMSVREIVRQLGHSNEFLEKSLLHTLPIEAAHGLYRRFLGRRAADDSEAQALARRFLFQGWQSQIDSLINSGEYLKKFGDDEPPR